MAMNVEKSKLEEQRMNLHHSVGTEENADFEIKSEEKVILDDGKYEEAAQAEISTKEEHTVHPHGYFSG